MKQTTFKKKEESLADVALTARQIGNTHDIFSGEKLRREELTKPHEYRDPYGSSLGTDKCHIIEPGTGGRLYSVSFICAFWRQFDAELKKAYDELAERKRKDYTQKGLDDDEIKILLDGTEKSRKYLRGEVLDFFVLGSPLHWGTLCATDLNCHYYSVKSGSAGVFLSGERNLKKQTSLRDLMQSSAISTQLSAGLKVIEPEYQQKVNLFLDDKISVESKLVDTIGIAQAYARGN